MSDKQKIIDDTKQLVSSILTSEKYGLDLRKLERAFQEFVGYPIPYSKMGFNNGRDFFYEIDDVVQVSHTADGQIHLDVITNEKIARVRKLVERQKDPVRKSALRPGGWRGGRGRGYAIRNNYGNNRGQPQPYRRVSQRAYPNVSTYGRRANQSQFVSARYQDRQSGVRQPLSHDTRPSYNQANESSYDSIRSHEAVSTERYRNLEWEESAPIRHQPQQIDQRPLEMAHTPSVPEAFRRRILDLLIDYPNGLLATSLEAVYERRYRERLSVVNMGFATVMDMLQSLADLIDLEHLPSGPVKIHQKKLNRVSAKEQRKEYKELADLKDDIRKILRMCGPSGIFCSKLPTEFKNLTGTELPFQKLGYQTLVKLVADMPDVAVVDRGSGSDWTVYGKVYANQIGAGVRTHVTKSAEWSHPSEKRQIEKNVREIMSEVGEIQLSYFPDKYWNVTGEQLDPNKFDCTSLEMLALKLNGKNVISMEERGGKLFLQSVEENPPQRLDEINLPKKDAYVPEDAVGPGVSYTSLSPEVVLSDAWTELFVCNVTNPGKLWLQLKGTRYTDALEHLMDRLEEYYDNPDGERYKVPESMITEGQVCAAVFPEDNNWHRVVITKILDENYVEGYFVDYGGSCSLHRNSLRLLKRVLMKLPAQAIRGRMANIKPKYEWWEQGASNRLLRLVSNRPLIGLVTHIDKEGIVSVCLCDTSGKDDLHINDLLVEEGYAVFARDEYETEATIMDKDSENQIDAAAIEPDLRNARELAEEQCDEDEEIETVRYLKYVELTDEYGVHIINKDRKPYVAGPEISHILFGKDILRSKLRTKSIQPIKLVVSQQEMPGLFEEFEELQVQGTLEKEYMTLYLLQSVIDIVDAFKHSCAELKEALAEQVQLFNPDDPYWKGEDDDDFTTSSSGGAGECSVEYLEKAVETLQYSRHKILRAILEPSNEQETKRHTDELFQTERRISDLRARIREMKEKQCAECTPSVDIDDAEFIQSTIEKMYAKDRERLNMLKNPATSKTKGQPVATVTGTNSSAQAGAIVRSDPGADVTSDPPAGNVAQVQNQLSDFISSLNLTGNSMTYSQPEGSNYATGLQNTPLFGPNTITGVSQLSTANSVQLQQQQQMLQMQILLNQQLMIQQSMGALGSAPGLGGVPIVNPGPGSGSDIATPQNPATTTSAMEGLFNPTFIASPTQGRDSRSSSNVYYSEDFKS